jgi:hypothetical protein
MPIKDLIYDIGMNNADDTAHYLSLGFRTVAIEANPELVEQAKVRFGREIASGRLIILNIGIADGRGSFRFGFARRTRVIVHSTDPIHRGLIRPITKSKCHVRGFKRSSPNMGCRIFARSTYRATILSALRASHLTKFRNFSQSRPTI